MKAGTREPSSTVPLQAAVGLLHEAFIITDTELDEPGPRILYCNPAFSDITGYRADELLGRSPRLLQGPDSDRDVLRRLRHCLEAGESFTGETINYRKTGEPFVMRWYIEPIRNHDGEITHFFAIQRDVTRELEANKQRRALEQAIGQLGDSVVLVGRGGEVRYANQAYQSWSGLEAKQVIGRLAWQLPGSPQYSNELREARERLSQGLDWQHEYAIQRSEFAEKRFVSLAVSPIRGADGEVAEFVAIGRDVTEQRRLESIAEAHNFHDHLGVVFSGIRHELGNPINSIKTALRVVSDGLETIPLEKQREYFERTSEEVRRVEYLLRSLRSYSLYDKPQLESINVGQFIAKFQKLAYRDLDQRAVRLEVRVDPAADTMWADPQALHQVLLNLLGNSLAVLEDHKHGKVLLRAQSRGQHLALIVRDNGPGIPADHLAHIFKPFYTTRSGGTGLGLPISRHLLSLMRGSIEITSSNRGTEARILLDRQQPRQDSKWLKP